MIRVYQCKDVCCTGREPSKRFWYVQYASFTATFTSWRAAYDQAAYDAARPLEVTA